MTYRLGAILLLVLVALGSCQMNKEAKKPSDMNEDDLPDVQAFDDEFTRDFLQSTEETEDGFYPFLSGTGKYKIDFPADGIIDKRSYSMKKQGYEEVHISIEDDTGFGMDVIYYSHHTKEGSIDILLDNFKGRLGYDGDFEKLIKDDKIIYYAHFDGNGFRNHVGYVLNKQDQGAVEMDYEIDCRDEKKETCEENKDQDEENMMKWIESVQFINDNPG